MREKLGERRFREAYLSGYMMTLDEGISLVFETIAKLQSRTETFTSSAGSVTRGLSRRETEVLRLIAQGMSDREIASTLYISHHTVMRHVSHILTKLDVHSRSAATRIAVEQGLLSETEAG
jgi:DNA-binding NarL/FixJ family response regulator